MCSVSYIYLRALGLFTFRNRISQERDSQPPGNLFSYERYWIQYVGPDLYATPTFLMSFLLFLFYDKDPVNFLLCSTGTTRSELAGASLKAERASR